MTNKTVRVLILEDNDDSAEMMQVLLEHEAFATMRAASLSEALALLDSNEYDVALVDLNVGDSVGIDTFRTIYEAHREMPIVILSAMKDEALTMQAVHEGAQDFLVKPTDERAIVISILKAIERHSHRLTGRALVTARVAIDLLKEVAERLEQLIQNP